MKWLLSLLVLVLGYAFWKSRRTDVAKVPEHLAKQKPAKERMASGHAAVPMPMLACAHCGLHLPQSDAHMQAGKAFCSPAHAKQAGAI